MAEPRDRKSETKLRPKRSRSKLADEIALPSDEERLPIPIPGAYQVAMGTNEEIVAWLQKVPRDSRAILIPFENEASYRVYGPIFWHVACTLPEIVARTQRRKFERLVDSLTQLFLASPSAESVTLWDAGETPAKKPLPRR